MEPSKPRRELKVLPLIVFNAFFNERHHYVGFVGFLKSIVNFFRIYTRAIQITIIVEARDPEDNERIAEAFAMSTTKIRSSVTAALHAFYNSPTKPTTREFTEKIYAGLTTFSGSFNDILSPFISLTSKLSIIVNKVQMKKSAPMHALNVVKTDRVFGFCEQFEP